MQEKIYIIDVPNRLIDNVLYFYKIEIPVSKFKEFIENGGPLNVSYAKIISDGLPKPNT